MTCLTASGSGRAVSTTARWSTSCTIADERGRRARQIRKRSLPGGEYDVYDTAGRRIGHIRESPVLEDQYDFFDQTVRRIGRVASD